MNQPLFKNTCRPKPVTLPYIVAEIGINFNGSYDLALKTIDAAVNAGVDAVKFQTFKADEFMADQAFKYEYTDCHGTRQISMYEMFKKYELPDDWHKRLRDYADSRHVDFLSSAADPAAVDLLCHVGVPALKFASEDLINTPLLEYAAGKDCPVILSTGMADQSEIDAAVDIFHKGHVPYMLLHCVSLYPTPDAYANVARIRTLRERYRVPVGYSDHTHGVSAAVLSVAYGAFMIEKHFTLDRNMEGPDHYFSADPNEMKELVQLVRCCEKQKGDGRLGFQDAEVKARNEYRRSIVAAYDLPAGAVIEKEMLCLKRPGNGIHPSEIPSITGRRLKHGLQQNQQLTWSDLDEC